MSARLRAYIRQHHVGLVAIFFTLSGGVAWASHPGGQNTINSADIIDGQVKVADVGEAAVASHELKNDSILPNDVAPDSLGSGRIATGAVRTEELQNGQVQAEDLAHGVAPGASGARAWGQVDSAANVLRSKNVSAVTHMEGTNVYCIDPGSGIDPTTAVIVVGGEFTFNGTSSASNNVSHVEWDSTPADCPVGTMEVVTFVGNGEPASGGETDSGGFDLAPDPEGFTFVIP